MILVDLPGYEDGLEDLAANTSLPVLQDTTDAGVAESMGATIDYTYVIGPDGYPRALFYSLDHATERERLIQLVDDVAAGRR